MKIIYLEEKEVKMGDKVSLNGAVVTVTQQLIDDLPNLFKVQDEQEIMPEYVECIKEIDEIRGAELGEILKSWYDPNKSFCYRFASKHGENGYDNFESFYRHFKPSTKEAWLLQEAKRRYPKGTKFTIIDNKTFTSDGKFKYDESWRGHGDERQTIQCTVKEEGVLDSSVWDSVLGWAEIVKPLFVTEDGVEIFEGDEYLYINDAFDINVICAIKGCQSEYVKARFSTREAAEEYIAKHKGKTLEDYENILLQNFSKVEVDVVMVDKSDMYLWMKEYEEKSYYSIVLQLIADDLNGESEPKLGNDGVCAINFDWRGDGKYNVDSWEATHTGKVLFSDRVNCKKAIKIMGDKLNYIYKS
jgi:hypothetical protein